MSWQATSWAARQTAGNSGRKALLLMVANAASPEGICFMGRAALAEGCECRPETVSANVGALETAGLLSRHQRRRANGSRTTDWIVLAPGWPDRGEMRDADPDDFPEEVAADARRRSGENFQHEESGGGQVGFSGSPEPSGEKGTSTTTDVSAKEARAGAADSLPDDFPEELKPHARAVYRLLVKVAEQHGAKEVKPLALGRVMMGRPRKPFVKSAHDFAAWAADPPRPIRDVVASYRTWIDREKDLQVTERLAPQNAAEGRKRFTRED